LHEAAHVADDELYGSRVKKMHHNKKWKNIMKTLGVKNTSSTMALEKMK